MTRHACPDCACPDARPPQPSTSSEWARRAALEAAKQAVDNARQKRMNCRVEIVATEEA